MTIRGTMRRKREEKEKGTLRQGINILRSSSSTALSRGSGVDGESGIETLRDKIRDRFGGAEEDTSTR